MKGIIKKCVVLFFVLGIFIILQNVSYAGNTTVDALKQKFPAGKFWNHYVGNGHNYYNGIEDSGSCNNPDGWTDTPCVYHDGTTASWGQADCNSFNGGQECAGFARKLFYDYYGQYATNMGKTYDKNSIKPGDVIRYEGDGAAAGGHEVWVIGINGNNLVVGECNWYKKCEISWDRWVNKNNISVSYIFPAPYAIDDNKRDTEKPNITNMLVDPLSMAEDTLTVRAKATDNVGVTRTEFRIWQTGSAATSGTTKGGKYNASTGYWEVTFKKSDMKKSGAGLCCVDVSAYDAEGNKSDGTGVYDFLFANKVNLGNFTARIVHKNNTNYCIGVSGNNNGDDLKLKTKNQNDKSQIWKFEMEGNGVYKITNLSNKKSIDVEGGSEVDSSGALMQIWSYSSSAPQHKFIIQEYNGGYRIVPTNTKALKGIDVKDGTASDNQPILLYHVGSTNNKAQTWQFEKVATVVTMNTNKAEINLGGKKQLSARLVYTTNQLGGNNVSWSSSDNSIASVTTAGVVTGKKAGTATITATAKDGGGAKAICKVTVSALPFVDVKTSDWYYNSIKYVFGKKYITGKTTTTYKPTDKITRGMLATIIWRMEGMPKATGKMKFTDVKAGEYYYDAIKWASSKKIVNGFSEKKFAPNKYITREQLVVMLNNYARFKKKYITTANISKYKDASGVAPYATDAVKWAVRNKIISGKNSGTRIAPRENTTRAEVAAMIESYYAYIR